jgi:hypothetical protein
MDRSRPIKRTLKKQKSQPAMFKPSPPEFKPSELKEYEAPKLPTGLRPMEATLALSENEKAILRKQAAGQAEQFEVLEAKAVTDLSRVCIEYFNVLTPTHRSHRNSELSTRDAIIYARPTNPFDPDARSYMAA